MRRSSAVAYFRSPGSQMLVNSTIMPMSIEPMNAPNAVPRPPRVTAAKNISSSWPPVNQLRPLKTRPRKTPARPARAAPMIQTMMGNYIEQSKNMFVQLQEQMQAQTRNMFQNFPFPGAPAPGASAPEEK